MIIMQTWHVIATDLSIRICKCMFACMYTYMQCFICKNNEKVSERRSSALHHKKSTAYICILQGIKNNITRRSNHPLRKLQGFVLSVRNWSNNIYIVIYRIIIHWKEIKKKINIFNKVVGNMVRRNYIITCLKLIMLRSNIMT